MKTPRVLRVSELTPAQAALVRALIGQKKAAPAVEKLRAAAQEGHHHVRPTARR